MDPKGIGFDCRDNISCRKPSLTLSDYYENKFGIEDLQQNIDSGLFGGFNVHRNCINYSSCRFTNEYFFIILPLLANRF